MALAVSLGTQILIPLMVFNRNTNRNDQKLPVATKKTQSELCHDKDVVGKKLDRDKYVDANLISPESEHSFKMEACADDDSIT